MSTLTITEFLEARISEDEAVARRVAAGPGEPGGHGMWSVAIGVSGNDAKFAHVASDPARVLAECAAKRAIIKECRHSTLDDLDSGADDQPAPMWVARALAAVYADHEDYRTEWAL